MLQTWRWFGPSDPVPLDHIRQAGATHIVSALQGIATGEVWPKPAVLAHKKLIEADNKTKTPLYWTVVESINVHDDIKTAAPGHQKYIENYCTSLRNLADHGITTVCYNFMPLIDWTRTDLNFQLANGASALRFDADKFAAFDLYILRRKAASQDYNPAQIKRAHSCYQNMSEQQIQQLIKVILAGLPGSTTASHSLDSFAHALKAYQNIDSNVLRENLFNFLRYVTPVAAEVGIKLAIHPDDPPRQLLGLPRIMSGACDIELLLQAVPNPANGITLCAGTYGVSEHNDVAAMAKQFSHRIYFAHLRGTQREQNPLSFHEASHLESDVDMIGIIKSLMDEEDIRKISRSSHQQIPIRPDHGHLMLDDLDKSRINPGYSAIGRLKGLAEIRGVIKTLQYFKNNRL